jgi:membrane fusion protein (multidrug efflux system)
LLPALLGSCKHEEAQAQPPPPEVVVAEVLQRDVPIYIEAIGQTRGSSEVEIRARVEGFLENVEFEEGSLVKKGQLLYTIDRRPFEATLARAKATRAQAEADLARAHQDVVRYEPLVAKNAISREEYETAVAIEQAATAAVDAAKAVVESAEIDLSYTKVLAPVDGLIGKTEVHPGALLSRVASTLLTQISTIDPIRARVTITEREYLYYARKLGTPETRDRQEEGRFELILSDRSIHPHRGTLGFVDRAVDPRSGPILVEISFPNPGGLVRPGQYARARVAVETREGALLVPQRAVQELQGLYNVVVVGADGKVEFRTVQPGERVGDLWLIESGLKPGDKIVVEGVQKVRPGIVVSAKEVPIEEGGDETAPGESKAEPGAATPAEPAAGEKE